jgi:hypothetical protein
MINGLLHGAPVPGLQGGLVPGFPLVAPRLAMACSDAAAASTALRASAGMANRWKK